MPRFKVAAAIAAVCACFFSCSGAAETVTGDTIEVTMSSLTAGSEAGSRVITVRCGGEWTLSLEFEDGVEAWAYLGPEGAASGKGDSREVFLRWTVNDSSVSRTCSVVLTSGDSRDSIVFTQLASGESDGPVGPGGDTPSMDLSGMGWMELPVMDDSSLEYFAHWFRHTDGKTYRNYSFAYSREDVVSVWVAYPLSKFYISGTEGRSDEWAYDPLLGMDSPAPFSRYAGDYDRGHLLPSNDRQLVGKGSHSEANRQTYYGTNIAPQIGKNFNQSIWGDLELKINGLASRVDTMYVVTGCILAGSKETSPDSDGKDITVPTAFFKACLAYNKASTFGTPWLSAGYLLEHKEYSGGQQITEDMTMTIEELEKETGITFFANLASKVGVTEATMIKKQNPDNVGFWN